MSQSILLTDDSLSGAAPASRLLVDCSAGQTCRVVGIDGDRALINRLMGLGVRIGSEVRIMQQRGQDVVIASTGNRIALGSAIARHLQVERVA